MSFKPYVMAAALSLAPVLTPISALAADPKITVTDAYARSTTPNAKSGAIFFELVNDGAVDRLVAVATPAAKTAQLHTHSEDENGVMRMQHVEEGFVLPSGKTVAFARGGKHVMLLGLTGPLEDGATVPLTLTFEKAGEVTVDVVVDRARKPKAGHGSGHANHGTDHSGHGTGHDTGHETGHDKTN